jgi:hypothetical protein
MGPVPKLRLWSEARLSNTNEATGPPVAVARESPAAPRTGRPYIQLHAVGGSPAAAAHDSSASATAATFAAPMSGRMRIPCTRE